MSKVIKRTICLCWIILFCFLFLKFFGNNYVDKEITNERFVNLCLYIDNHIYFKYGLYLLINLITNTIYLCAVCGVNKFKFKQYLWLLPVLIIFYFLKLWNDKVGLATDVINAFILPFLLGLKFKKFYKTIFGFVLDIGYQFIMIYIKNLTVYPYFDEHTLTSIIWCIDYYIVLILYYLYVNLKRREKNNG